MWSMPTHFINICDTHNFNWLLDFNTEEELDLNQQTIRFVKLPKIFVIISLSFFKKVIKRQPKAYFFLHFSLLIILIQCSRKNPRSHIFELVWNLNRNILQSTIRVCLHYFDNWLQQQCMHSLPECLEIRKS